MYSKRFDPMMAFTGDDVPTIPCVVKGCDVVMRAIYNPHTRQLNLYHGEDCIVTVETEQIAWEDLRLREIEGVMDELIEAASGCGAVAVTALHNGR